MIIYEVNLQIQPKNFDDYLTWLKEHVQKMLDFPGFLQAQLRQDLDNANHISVCYTIKDEYSLEHYLTQHADKMRAEGLEKFADQFSASRRIFRTLDDV